MTQRLSLPPAAFVWVTLLPNRHASAQRKLSAVVRFYSRAKPSQERRPRLAALEDTAGQTAIATGVQHKGGDDGLGLIKIKRRSAQEVSLHLRHSRPAV